MSEKIETVDIHGQQHPTYEAVLKLAHEKGLKSLTVEVTQVPNQDNHLLAVCSATAVFADDSVFTEIGDASPKNVNSMIAPHIMRMAATRAKGRALRDGLNIAQALQEEFGGDGKQDKKFLTSADYIERDVEQKRKEISNLPEEVRSKPATDKQVNAVIKIATRKGYDADKVKGVAKKLSVGEASSIIGEPKLLNDVLSEYPEDIIA